METVNSSGTDIVIGDAPVRQGFTFKGYLDESTDTLYQPGDIYTVTNNVVFIAQWE